MLARKSALLIVVFFLGHAEMIRPHARVRQITVAVLDFGNSVLGKVATDQLVKKLKSVGAVSIIDRDAGMSAVRGAGYAGSLNLSLKEARDLGEGIGCDFYFIGDAQTLRRSVSSKPIYFESYASIFLVSSRTGKLVMWERPSFEGTDPTAVEQKLLDALARSDLAERYWAAIQKASSEEKQQRELAIATALPIIEEVPEDEKAAEAVGLRMPRPYRRLRPVYPETAARADAEAVVDVFVDLDAAGEVVRIDVTRWAGFGLDEATVDTVRQLHFFPAMRNGRPIPIRILLRYNFRKPVR